MASAEISVEPGDWSAGERESDSDFRAPGSEVLVGRKHQGDEAGRTYYKTGKVMQDGVYLQTANVVASDPVAEYDGTRYVAPAGRVLVGRSHSGDENGTTRYYHAQVLDKSGTPLTVVHGTWSNSQKESDSSFVAPADQVLVGRRHIGDENGTTEYLTATLYPSAPAT
ncbi:hypothetical protein [Streptomyces xanthochromogenes]|uniref:hypothetical protein n=1 Tax=Streptomyces xanthochromogenes TaxID=67384 RepID=UPI003808A35C